MGEFITGTFIGAVGVALVCVIIFCSMIRDQDQFVNCATCATRFAIDKDLLRLRRKDHKEFMCPNSHSNTYPAAACAEQHR